MMEKMSDKKKRYIEVSIMISTNVRLEVSWDQDAGTAEVHSAERTMIQHGISARDIYERADEYTLEYIDEETKKVFGIKDGD
jgi:hypothetical protein